MSNAPDPLEQEPVRPDPEGPESGRVPGGWKNTLITTAMATLALLPVNAIAGLVLLFSLETYDDSGRGAPFGSCTADSTSCAGPSYGVAAVAGLCCLGTFFLAAWAGRHSGRLPWRFLFPLGAFSAGLTLAGVVVLYGLAVVFLLAG